jgi:Flp pilus assembly protein TadB
LTAHSGRATVNDKPFLKEFPYLAEPWDSTQPAAAAPSIGVSGALAAVWDITVFSAGLIDKICTPIMMLLVVVVIIVAIVIWLFVRWRRKRATA